MLFAARRRHAINVPALPAIGCLTRVFSMAAMAVSSGVKPAATASGVLV